MKYPNKIYLNIGGSIWQLAAVNGKIKLTKSRALELTKYLDNLSFTILNERFTEITPRKDYSFSIKIEIIAESIQTTSSDILNEMLELKKLKLIKK